MTVQRLQPIHTAPLSQVKAVFTDVDGTLTTNGKLTGNTLKAIEWLKAHGVKVVLVSGRPAGFGEAWARQLPVEGVIVENGALYFATSADGSLTKTYLQPLKVRVDSRKKLERILAGICRRWPTVRLSSDSRFTEVDLALDIAEDAQVPAAQVRKIEAALADAGVTAVRSSVHINCWLGTFDKLKAVRHFVKSQFKTTLRPDDRRFVYVGDSFNDEPMFRAFSLSVGVANVLAIAKELEFPPVFVTRAREGRGFGEVDDAIARQQKRGRT